MNLACEPRLDYSKEELIQKGNLAANPPRRPADAA